MNWKDMPKLPLVLIAVMFLVGIVMYPQLPETIPTHWGLSGAPDAWSAKSFGSVFSMPLVAIGMYVLLLVAPYIDPKRANLLRSKKAYGVIIDAVTALLGVMFVVTLMASFNHTLPVDRITLVSVGLLFIVIGNYMTTVKRNWTMGVRFSWTVLDDEVWRKTNRLGAWMFMGAGVCSIIGAFLPQPLGFVLMLAPVLGMLPVLYVYSFREYKKRHPEDMGTPPTAE